MSQSYTNLLYHIVYSTKHRQPWLDSGVRTRLCEYLGGAIRGEGGVPLIVNGTADHIHILAKLRRDKAISHVIGQVKANASGWMKGAFPQLGDFSWQAGYGAFSVSQSQAEKAGRYIANQDAHHCGRPYENEFVALLDAHGIEYDGRYLWD